MNRLASRYIRVSAFARFECTLSAFEKASELTRHPLSAFELRLMLRVFGVDEFAFEQRDRRVTILPSIVERVGDDLRQPHESGLHIAQKEQVHGAEQQSADA